MGREGGGPPRYRASRVGVLMGGPSPEREISLRTGRAVMRALLERGYEAVGIDAWGDLFVRLGDQGVEVAFIALHGGWGEDGSVQGGLEVMGIPYTGSGVLASALAMDKVMTKRVLAMNSIETPAYTTDPSEAGLSEMAYPLVVKPRGGGSTIGLSLVHGPEGLDEAVERASAQGTGLLIEEYVEGRELSVSVLHGRVLPVVEILREGPLYDYDAKYSPGGAAYRVPAVLHGELGERVGSAALGAYEALGCRGAARVDMIVPPSALPAVLEVNTSPGLTERSLLPMAAREAGLSYGELVEEILEGASLEHEYERGSGG